jgi:large subunit ribosomal protein L1
LIFWWGVLTFGLTQWLGGEGLFRSGALDPTLSKCCFENYSSLPVNVAMATARPCLAQLSRACLHLSRSQPATLPTRLFSTSTALASRGKNVPKIVSKKEKAPPSAKGNTQKYAKKTVVKKKKARTTFVQYDLSKEGQFSLLDAMRYGCTCAIETSFTDGS